MCFSELTTMRALPHWGGFATNPNISFALFVLSAMFLSG
jgi:hypothetical protein